MYRSRNLILVFVAIQPWVGGGCARSDAVPPPQRLLPQVVACRAAIESEFSYPLTVYGRLEPRQKTALSFELPGQVDAVLVDEGMRIAAGQELARLNVESLTAERALLRSREAVESSLLARLRKGERQEVLAIARAEIVRWEAETEQARLHVERTSRLRQQNAITEAEHEAADFGHRSAKASLEKARQRWQELAAGTREEDLQSQEHRLAAVQAEGSLLDLKLKKSVLRSPYAADVVRRSVDAGTVVAAGQVLLEIHESDRYEVRFSVPLRYAAEISKVNAVLVRGRSIPVVAHRQTTAVDHATRTVDFLLEIQPPEHNSIFAGETCSLTLEARQAVAAVPLPVTALVSSIRGLWSCYRLEALNSEPMLAGSSVYRALKTDLTVLHTDGKLVYVAGDLPEGVLVISEGTHKVVPGMQVRVTESSP